MTRNFARADQDSETGCILRVLIVDDAGALRERLAEMLSQVSGLDIAGEAANVAEALSAIRELQPDLVILDLQLPDGNGLQVLWEAKQNYANMKVIILTNQPEAQYKQRCAALGADFFLCKSTDSDLLVEIAETLTVSEGDPQ